MSRQNEPELNGMHVVLFLVFAAFLSALLFPMFGPDFRIRPQAACASNEKQLGLALLQYDQDYDNLYPPGTQLSVVYGKPQMAGVGWGGQLYSYIRSTGLYACPSDQGKTETTISYALNTNLVRNHVKANLLKDPAHTIAVFEVENAHADVMQWDEGASKGATRFSPVGDGTTLFIDDGVKVPSVVYATGAMGRRPALNGIWLPARHKGIGNYLMADGHVKWLKPQLVSTGEDAAHPSDPQTGAVSGHAAGTANGAYAVTFSKK